LIADQKNQEEKKMFENAENKKTIRGGEGSNRTWERATIGLSRKRPGESMSGGMREL